MLNCILGFSSRKKGIGALFALFLATSRVPLLNGSAYVIFTAMPTLFVTIFPEYNMLIYCIYIKSQTVFLGFCVENKQLELHLRNI